MDAASAQSRSVLQHVVSQALVGGTPVLGSRIDGNVELLGADDSGPFPDSAAVYHRIPNRSISAPDSLSLCSRLTRTARRYKDRRYGERLRGEVQRSSGVADHAGFAIGWPRQRQQKLS